MASVTAHYADHLASIYVWMAGGFDHAIDIGSVDVAEFLGTVNYVVDLGAGFGMHAIPLARASASVLAIDSSDQLLSVLRENGQGLDIDTACVDLLEFRSKLRAAPDLVLCMGDTLTHLEDAGQVQALIVSVAASLRPGGAFVTTFRDYTKLPAGDSRFIPVRSDGSRIHTCFLEEFPQHVLVTDLIHERVAEQWQLRISSYRKLRLNPDDIVTWATAAGMRCKVEAGPRGMVKVCAEA